MQTAMTCPQRFCGRHACQPGGISFTVGLSLCIWSLCFVVFKDNFKFSPNSDYNLSNTARHFFCSLTLHSQKHKRSNGLSRSLNCQYERPEVQQRKKLQRQNVVHFVQAT